MISIGQNEYFNSPMIYVQAYNTEREREEIDGTPGRTLLHMSFAEAPRRGEREKERTGEKGAIVCLRPRKLRCDFIFR